LARAYATLKARDLRRGYSSSSMGRNRRHGVSSNDATAVVLTPAVYARPNRPRHTRCLTCSYARSWRMPQASYCRSPIPRIWCVRCAYASSVELAPSVRHRLPIFDRGNISAASLHSARCIGGTIERDVQLPGLGIGGLLAGTGILMTAVVLLIASSLDWQLGLPTFLAGVTRVSSSWP